MKIIKWFFIIGAILLFLLSLLVLITNTEVEYDNKALCFYIDYALYTISISSASFILGVVFLIISANTDIDDDFSHITRKF
jgi:hypothetical protein